MITADEIYQDIRKWALKTDHRDINDICLKHTIEKAIYDAQIEAFDSCFGEMSELVGGTFEGCEAIELIEKDRTELFGEQEDYYNART